MSDRLLGLLFVLGAVVTEAVAHIFWKQAADSGHREEGLLAVVRAALREHQRIALGVVFFIGEAVCWTLALRHLEVSLAYPLGSLELIVVVLLARIMLKEQVGLRRWVGVGLIVGGTTLVGLS